MATLVLLRGVPVSIRVAYRLVKRAVARRNARHDLLDRRAEYNRPALDEITIYARLGATYQVARSTSATYRLMTAAHNLLDTSEPYTLLSGYRSPVTQLP